MEVRPVVWSLSSLGADFDLLEHPHFVLGQPPQIYFLSAFLSDISIFHLCFSGECGRWKLKPPVCGSYNSVTSAVSERNSLCSL